MQDKELILEVMVYTAEIFTYVRKGVPQSYYVGEVKADATYWDGENLVAVPQRLVGYYKMPYDADLTQSDFVESMKRHGFVRCKRVAVTTYTYQ